jgi:CubicO group peptidase (beta-lactamase class C family)
MDSGFEVTRRDCQGAETSHMQTRASTLLGLLVAASLPMASAQPLPVGRPAAEGFDPARLKRVREGIEDFISTGRYAGAAWLIARNGKVIEFHSAGSRDVQGALPMEKDTICRIYSMSKIVTSVAVLCLMEEGRLVLDDPIEKFLPDLKGPMVLTGGTADAPELADAKSTVTIRHLLTHTSGYIYDFGGDDPLSQLYKRQDLWNATSLDEFIDRVARLPLKHSPGEAFTYGINNDILGALIEVVSRQTFEDFMQARICKPLGMSDTSFDVPPEKMNRLAKIHSQAEGSLRESQDFLGSYPEKGRGIPCGGAGLFSTVADYTRFAQMLLNGGVLDGQRILSRKTIELMTANHLQLVSTNAYAFTPGKGFGLGVEVQLDLGRGVLPGSPGQFGWYGAATTYCQIDPKENIVAILFAQHFPFNEHGLFGRFQNSYFQALVD